ncbi:hypothetical protein SOASR029_03290 [Budvicia aquatica]|nr:hypothetical protein SOASR029_03290 [Budvicia aquatica]
MDLLREELIPPRCRPYSQGKNEFYFNTVTKATLGVSAVYRIECSLFSYIIYELDLVYLLDGIFLDASLRLFSCLT